MDLLNGYKSAIKYVHENYIECNIRLYKESEKYFIFALETPLATNKNYPEIIVEKATGAILLLQEGEIGELGIDHLEEVPSELVAKYSLFNNENFMTKLNALENILSSYNLSVYNEAHGTIGKQLMTSFPKVYLEDSMREIAKPLDKSKIGAYYYYYLTRYPTLKYMIEHQEVGDLYGTSEG